MLSSEGTEMSPAPQFSLPAFEEQMQIVKQLHLETLLFCPDPWALRHRFINWETGEVVRVRCDRWRCQYCGPRKVDIWRQLIQATEPVLFVTLTRVGKTLKEESRVLTTVLQYLRRGSKGRGPDSIGARPAYAIECFAVLEEHSDFEHLGFHWHLLVKGVDYIPKSVLEAALRSATRGYSYIVDVRAVEKTHAVGNVTKYLTKEIDAQRRRVREVQREVVLRDLDEAGNVVERVEVQTV